MCSRDKGQDRQAGAPSSSADIKGIFKKKKIVIGKERGNLEALQLLG